MEGGEGRISEIFSKKNRFFYASPNDEKHDKYHKDDKEGGAAEVWVNVMFIWWII